MQAGHSKAYEGLALWAGREVGLDTATLQAVADHEGAREVRDAAWAKYRRILADKTSYPMEVIHAWLAERGADVSDAAISRDRAPVKAREQQLSLSVETTRQFLDATKGATDQEVLRAAIRRIGQVLFETSLKFDAEGLAAAMEAGDVMRLGDTVAKLARALAETDLLGAKLAELQRKLDEAKAAADKQAKAALESKGVDAKTIDQIRQIYGLPPLAEVA